MPQPIEVSKLLTPGSRSSTGSMRRPTVLQSSSTPLPSRPTPLNLDDSRRALIGTWKTAFAPDTIEIVADSVSSPPRYTRNAGGSSWTTGTLQLRDTLVASESDELFARFDIDFAPILTRPMSCFEAGEGRVGV